MANKLELAEELLVLLTRLEQLKNENENENENEKEPVKAEEKLSEFDRVTESAIIQMAMDTESVIAVKVDKDVPAKDLVNFTLTTLKIAFESLDDSDKMTVLLALTALMREK